MPRLTDYRALTFDCYGTLIDWEIGIWDALQPVILHNAREDLTRETALGAFARWESRQQQAAPGLPYPELLARVHRSIAESFGLETNPDLDAAFGASVPHWPAFPDTADGLRLLSRHYKLVILSNVHRDGIAASRRKLGVEFDAVYTAQDIGSYKPADANFAYLLAHLKSDLGLDRSQVLHVAQSLYHDHAPGQPFRHRQRLDRPAAAVERRELGRDRADGSCPLYRFCLLLHQGAGLGGGSREGKGRPVNPFHRRVFRNSQAPALLWRSFEEKRPILNEDEPRMDTNEHEDRWTSFSGKRRQNASVTFVPLV